VAEVEFAFIVEEWSLDVGLDDEGAVTSIGVLLSLFENGFDLI
jgi:hypothetical protein